jgi:ABC-2 type transport system permease protein/lipopolysaccharide transport system permease protein
VLYALPGLALLILNGAMASMTLGMVSARFRDIPRITASLMQIVFLITPIIWKPDMLGDRLYISLANPFFHLIEIVRAPLLGTPPTLLNVAAVILITLINCLTAIVLFSKYRSRIAYWI